MQQLKEVLIDGYILLLLLVIIIIIIIIMMMTGLVILSTHVLEILEN